MFWIALRQIWLNDHTKKFVAGGESRASLKREKPAVAPRRTSSLHNSKLADPAPVETQPLPAFINEWKGRSREAYCIINQDGSAAWTSPNWELSTGLKPTESEASGWFDERHRKQIVSMLKQAKTKAWKTCISYPRKGETTCSLEWELIQKDRMGEHTTAVFLVRDVTEEVALRRKLEEVQATADLAMKSRSEFLANMSHELRTPLNAILGFAQIMESRVFGDIENPRYQSYLGNIKDSGEALLGRINDLLELSNLDAGKTTLNEEKTSLEDIIRFAVEVHSHNAFSSDISVIYKSGGDTTWVQGDRVKLQQAISHLLSNAIKFNRPGGFVTIECRNKAKGLDITVTDSGEGIPSDKLESICGMLERGERLWLSDAHVLGVGLALAQEYIGLHGGELDVKSHYGKGTSVTLHLPKSRLISVNTPASAVTERDYAEPSIAEEKHFYKEKMLN